MLWRRQSRKKRLRRPCTCLRRTIEGKLRQGMDQAAKGHLRTHRRRKSVHQVMTMALHGAPCVPGPIPASAGIGLRAQHQAELLDSNPAVDWLEAHSENYFSNAGPH